MKLIYIILIITVSYLYEVNAWFGCHKGACWRHCGNSIERTFKAWCYTGKTGYISCNSDSQCNSYDNGVHFDSYPCYSSCAAF